MTHRFVPATRELAGHLVVDAPIETAFPCFSPLGERAWVPGWDPELLGPPGASWEQGQIFRTREATGDAIWIVTRLERAAHAVEYHRVEPGRYVARVRVECRRVTDRQTEVRVSYVFLGLSSDGNADIAAMSAEAYAEKMARWTRWIGDSLARKGGTAV